MEPHDVTKHLQAAAVPANPGVYVLGCFDLRVTVYSQQVRALNLVDALFESGALASGRQLVVVGAGVAGLTAAAAAIKLGAQVVVLERGDDILTLFATANGNRWLHPRLYDWPYPGWDSADAGLPLLNWTAGLVPDVLQELRAAWKNEGEAADVKTGVCNVELKSDEGRVLVKWEGCRRHLEPTCVILAVGFGPEKISLPEERPYFELDGIDGDVPKKWLISGTGDGALTDLMRLCIKDCRHDETLRSFLAVAADRGLEQHAREIEAEALRTEAVCEGETIVFQKYLTLEPIFKATGCRSRGLDVSLNARRYWLQPKASAVNRFVATQLYLANMFQLEPGETREVEVTADDARRVCLTLDGVQRVMTYDRLLRRHGTEPAIKSSFAEIWKATHGHREARTQLRAALDCTRRRDWVAETYGHETRVHSYDIDRADPSDALSLFSSSAERRAHDRLTAELQQLDIDLAFVEVHEPWHRKTPEALAAEMMRCDPAGLVGIVSDVFERHSGRIIREPMMDALTVALPWTMGPWSVRYDDNDRARERPIVNASTPLELALYRARANEMPLECLRPHEDDEIAGRGYVESSTQGSTSQQRLTQVAEYWMRHYDRTGTSLADIPADERFDYMAAFMKAEPMLYFTLFRDARKSGELDFLNLLTNRLKDQAKVDLSVWVSRPRAPRRQELADALRVLIETYLSTP